MMLCRKLVIAFLVCASTSTEAFQPLAPKNIRLHTSLAAISVEERAPRDVGTLQEWAQAMDVQRGDGVELIEDDDGDWSARTTVDMPAETTIFAVPNSLLWSSTQIRNELPLEEAAEYLGRLGAGDQVPIFTLFCKLLAELDRPDFEPWLNSMPRLFYNAVSMTDLCYECLPPLVFMYSRTERVKFDNFCKAMEKIDFIPDAVKRDVTACKWAYNVVTTRSRQIQGDEYQMVPMVDMFNHGTDTNVDVSYDPDGNCYAFASRDIPAGSPLLLSHGDPTNPSKLFAQYGFLDESSPATFCKLTFPTVTEEMKNVGYDFTRMLFYQDGEVSEEVWDVLLYQHLASDRSSQQAFYEAHMSGDSETKNAIHQHYFPETSTALQKHVDGFLEQLEELSRKGDGKDLAQHPRLPLILRHNEFVKNSFLRVKERLDPMVAQAAQEPVAA